MEGANLCNNLSSDSTRFPAIILISVRCEIFRQGRVSYQIEPLIPESTEDTRVVIVTAPLRITLDTGVKVTFP